MAIQIKLFDRFAVVAETTGIPLRLRPRARRLIAYLILHRDRSAPREHVAFALWPDDTDENALASLRRALSDARSSLESAGAGDSIVLSGDELRWNPTASGRIDIAEFAALIEQNTPASLEEATNLYAGDLLASWSDEWVVAERERLSQLQVGALRRLVTLYSASGESDRALAAARRALALDPFDEATYRDVMTLHARRGDRAAALNAYERLRIVLRDELGVDPMPETESIRAAIAAGKPSSATTQPPESARRSPTLQTPTRLIGRDNDLGRLVAEWETASDGQGRMAIVSGEAGIGKTRLALALADHVNRSGGLVLTGHCYRLEQALPYQPITEMLRAARMELHGVELAPAHRAALGRLAPDVLGSAPASSYGADGAIDPRALLFEALSQAFVELARSRPLVLLFEDLHLAADPTLDWLAYAGLSMQDSRVLTVATYRTEEAGAAGGLNQLRRHLKRQGVVTTLALQPLSIVETRELIASQTHLPDDVAVPLAERLQQETAGNPFFLHEILRGLVESGHVAVNDGRWDASSVDVASLAELPLPESLRETIAARVLRLSEGARSFLVAAAVSGRAFDYDVVCDAGGWGDERALESLEELLARNVVHPTGVEGSFSFSHDLVRDAVYADLTTPRRVFWHRRVVDAFVRATVRLPTVEQPLRAGQIAFHALAAERDALVFQWAPLAAQHDQVLYAYANALRLLEAASVAFERLRLDPTFDIDAGERELIEVLLRQSALIPHVGRSLDEHGVVLEQTAELLSRHPDERRQARLNLRQSDYLADQRRYEDAARASIQASEQCLAVDDTRGAALGLYQAGRSWMTVGRNRAAIGAFERSLELYRSAGDAAGEAQCLSGIAWANLNLGEVEIALGYLNHALQLSERQADKAGTARICYSLAGAWSAYYNAEHALYYSERATSLYREIGFAWTAYRPMLFTAVGHMLNGDLPASTTLLQQVVDEAHAIQDSWLEGWASQLLGRLALTRGDLEEAERLIESAYRLRLASGEAQNLILDLIWLGRLRLAQGRPDEALTFSARAVEQLASLGDEVYVWELPDVLLALAEILSANGDRPGAVRYVGLAHDALLRFAAQMRDPSVKSRFLSVRNNVRIMTSWEAGQLLD